MRNVTAAFMLIAISTTANAAATQDELVRNKMHRNAARQTEYIPLANADAPFMRAFKVLKSFAIDGTAALNDNAGLVVIDVNGDGVQEFLHYNGARQARVYTHAGQKLWEVNDTAGRPNKDSIHPNAVAVRDFDGDGGEDIAHCWNNNAAVVIRDGQTGAVLKTAAIPKIPDDDCHVASYMVEGRATPIIMVSLVGNATTCAGIQGRSTHWATTRAFDVNLQQLWQADTCDAGHHPHMVDADQDNAAESIFVGKYRLNPNTGAKLCTLPVGGDHVDGLQIADVIRTRAGLEVALVGAVGGGLYDSTNCARIWAINLTDPQNVVVADLYPELAGLEVAFQQRPSQPTRTLQIRRADGTVLKQLAGGQNGMPSVILQSTNIDASGPEEIVGYASEILNQNGALLGPSTWFGPTRNAQNQPVATYPIVMDLYGDKRPEIVMSRHAVITVGQAEGALGPPPSDVDGDGVPDATDNCVNVANPDQADADSDGIGDACEPPPPPPDTDGDGFPDATDNCPAVMNPNQTDADDDGIGDVCEADGDGDGVVDDYDNCLTIPNPDQADADGDLVGDACDEPSSPSPDEQAVQIMRDVIEQLEDAIQILEQAQ